MSWDFVYLCVGKSWDLVFVSPYEIVYNVVIKTEVIMGFRVFFRDVMRFRVGLWGRFGISCGFEMRHWDFLLSYI